jgi:dTDP-4-dehydrorhamnose 3,5-epimerase
MPFERLPTRLEDVALIQPAVHADERGFFVETFRRGEFEELGVGEEMVQDNHSRSRRGIVRGMHFQVGDGAAKLVRCGRGRIADVVVDLRRGSPTYGEWESFELSDENGRIAYVPIGFAHGFCVVSEVADVFYKQSAYYRGELERGFKYDDPEVGIEWPLPAAELVPSERDATAPMLREIAGELPFEYRP